MRVQIPGTTLSEICTAVTTIFSIINAGFLIIWGKMWISSHAPSWKHQIKRMFLNHCRSVILGIEPASYHLATTIWWQLLEFWKICEPLYMHIRISLYLVQSCFWFVTVFWIEHSFIIRQPAYPISQHKTGLWYIMTIAYIFVTLSLLKTLEVNWHSVQPLETIWSLGF
jgi:hypothetical protein